MGDYAETGTIWLARYLYSYLPSCAIACVVLPYCFYLKLLCQIVLCKSINVSFFLSFKGVMWGHVKLDTFGDMSRESCMMTREYRNINSLHQLIRMAALTSYARGKKIYSHQLPFPKSSFRVYKPTDCSPPYMPEHHRVHSASKVSILFKINPLFTLSDVSQTNQSDRKPYTLIASGFVYFTSEIHYACDGCFYFLTRKC
jgi:hypothetical protein